MGVFDKLADKLSDKAEDKAVEIAKKRIADNVQSKYERAKSALFGKDEEDDPELAGKSDAERVKILKAREEEAAQAAAEHAAAAEAKRARIAELKKQIAAEKAAQKAEDLAAFQARKARESAEVDDELAALKRKLGK